MFLTKLHIPPCNLKSNVTEFFCLKNTYYLFILCASLCAYTCHGMHIKVRVQLAEVDFFGFQHAKNQTWVIKFVNKHHHGLSQLTGPQPVTGYLREET